MNIEPGLGIGDIRYGITEEELISLMGRPDKVEEMEYVQGNGDWHRELWYSPRSVHFTFDKDDDYRLGTITIMGSGFTIFGEDLFGLPLDFVRKFIARSTKEIAKLEDWIWNDEETHECLQHDGLGILFWFEDGNLAEMQCSYLFEADNQTVIWPKSHSQSVQ